MILNNKQEHFLITRRSWGSNPTSATKKTRTPIRCPLFFATAWFTPFHDLRAAGGGGSGLGARPRPAGDKGSATREKIRSICFASLNYKFALQTLSKRATAYATEATIFPSGLCSLLLTQNRLLIPISKREEQAPPLPRLPRKIVRVKRRVEDVKTYFQTLF